MVIMDDSSLKVMILSSAIEIGIDIIWNCSIGLI